MSRRRYRIDEFAIVARAFAAARGVSIARASHLIFQDGQKLGAILDKGADLTSRRLDTAIWWISDNWPDGADWPAGVARPRR